MVVRLGFLGLGTVNGGALKAIRDGGGELVDRLGFELRPVSAAVRDPNRPRAASLEDMSIVTDPLQVAVSPDVDIVVEAIGGVGIAYQAVGAALAAGKGVVTANKELIAKHGQELFRLAHEHNCDLEFEGSVAGGIPVLQPLRESLAGNRISSILGIINGTTNYILSAMQRTGRPFDELLAEAQAAGYAEADPTDDVDGHDAAYKLAILATLAFDTAVDINAVPRQGIRTVQPADMVTAERLGYVIKLLGIAVDRGQQLELRVHPTLVPRAHPLAAVQDVFNAIYVVGSSSGPLMFYGRGAGAGPTGSAVLGDIINVARNLRLGVSNRASLYGTGQREPVPRDEVRSCHYLRMRVIDQAGVMAQLARILGDNGVSLAKILQMQGRGETAELVIITHETEEWRISRSLAEMKALRVVLEICNTMRCLDEYDS